MSFSINGSYLFIYASTNYSTETRRYFDGLARPKSVPVTFNEQKQVQFLSLSFSRLPLLHYIYIFLLGDHFIGEIVAKERIILNQPNAVSPLIALARVSYSLY